MTLARRARAAALGASFVSVAALVAQRPPAATPAAQRPVAAAQASAAPPPAPAPAGVVQTFYAFHFSHDMAFTRAAVRARSRWFSPDLLVLCRAYFARPDNPDEVPAIDGDPFTDSQEYPGTFRVGAPTVVGDTALVPVALFWTHTEYRTVTVVLVSGRGGWHIADVRYASRPSLRELLTP